MSAVASKRSEVKIHACLLSLFFPSSLFCFFESESYYVAQIGFELKIPLLQFTEFWDYSWDTTAATFLCLPLKGETLCHPNPSHPCSLGVSINVHTCRLPILRTPLCLPLSAASVLPPFLFPDNPASSFETSLNNESFKVFSFPSYPF